MRKEIEGRIVQVYRRTGRLEELVQRLEKELTESPDDLATAEMCAAVLTGMRELDRAVALLQKLTPRFPKDVSLARRIAELHVEREDFDAAIREYQRILEEKPDELDLYLELGALFARSDRFAEAKLQWEQALAKRMTDASLCARLASTYALYDQIDDAIRLYRRAVELEPDSMPRYVDLAQFLIAHDKRDDGIAVLDDALKAADGKPRRLEILVPALRECELTDRARTALEGILAAEPDNHEIRYALADLLLVQGETDRARELLWEVVDRCPPASGQRTLAANTLAGLARGDEQRAALIAEAEQHDSAGAAFVVGRAKTRARDFDGAIQAYQLAVERDPLDVESRRLLARLYAEDGRYDEALEAYHQIAMVAPGEERHNFREVARLHLERYDLDSAIETWQRAMRDNPGNAAVFVQVGKEFLQVNRVQEALDAFRQAARLKSEDPDILMQLADALKRTGRTDEAEQNLLHVATKGADPRDRELARARLFQLYAEQGEIEQRMAALRTKIEENPYDQDAPQLLADLYIRTGDFVLGLDMVDEAVRFQPRNEELLTRRAEILESLEEWQAAHDQHEELLKFPGADRDAHLAGMGRALYELGRADEAKELFRQIRDRGRVRDLYERYKLHDEAVEYYRREIARDPSDARSYYRLATELEKLRKPDDAIEALEHALNLKPYYREALQMLGKLYVQSGRRERGRADRAPALRHARRGGRAVPRRGARAGDAGHAVALPQPLGSVEDAVHATASAGRAELFPTARPRRRVGAGAARRGEAPASRREPLPGGQAAVPVAGPFPTEAARVPRRAARVRLRARACAARLHEALVPRDDRARSARAVPPGHRTGRGARAAARGRGDATGAARAGVRAAGDGPARRRDRGSPGRDREGR